MGYNKKISDRAGCICDFVLTSSLLYQTNLFALQCEMICINFFIYFIFNFNFLPPNPFTWFCDFF
jgi:hypothetical protein